MKNLRMVLFVLAVALVMMSVNASAQNLGEVVFQQQPSTTLAKSLLYHFIGKVGSAFDTAMSLSNVRTNPTSAQVPGTFTIWLVNSDGTVVTAPSNTLPAAGFNLVGTPPRALGETTAFFVSAVLAARSFPSTSNFLGYGIVSHSFPVGTGVANVIDFTGAGFNIGYVAAQYDRTAANPTLVTKVSQ
jgi:hypothetical protein